MAPPTVLPRFDPPAFLTDLKDEQALNAWSDTLSGWMQDEIQGKNQGRKPLTQFFDGTKTAYDQSASQAKITWIGFPRRVHGDDETRWKTADSSRDFQDEYLEWSILRDTDKNITRITYTCEGPEYWEFLGFFQRDATVALIKELNAPLLDHTKMEDFFTQDTDGTWRYDRNNKHNNTTEGGTIINLFQRNNTLGAEIDIAAQGTVIRKNQNDKIVTDQDALIKCSQYGDPDRNSDPVIGGSINALARQGFTISVANPVALYMHSFDTSNLYLDTSGNRDGTDMSPIPDSWIELQRGKALGGNIPLALRLCISNKEGHKTADGSRVLDVGDIWDDSTKNNIRYGAQFADHILMGVSGVTGTKGPQPTVDQASACLGSRSGAAKFAVSALAAAGKPGPLAENSMLERHSN